MGRNHTKRVEMPKTKREGLANAIQLAINDLEAGNHREALLRMVDLLDDVTSASNPYDLKPVGEKGRNHTKVPKFVEADRHVVQVYGTDGVWRDYASIKSATDMRDAVRLVEGGGGYRIVECHMGTRVVFGLEG